MKVFKDWSDEQIKSLKAPALVVNGNVDVGRPEHAVEMYRIIPNCQLAMLPGGHGAYIGEVSTGMENSRLPDLTVSMFEEFPDKAEEPENYN